MTQRLARSRSFFGAFDSDGDGAVQVQPNRRVIDAPCPLVASHGASIGRITYAELAIHTPRPPRPPPPAPWVSAIDGAPLCAGDAAPRAPTARARALAAHTRQPSGAADVAQRLC
jgi:hypothetical protein